MTRSEAIEEIKYHLIHRGGATQDQADIAFMGPSPLNGALFMLEALGLVKFEDTPVSWRNL